MLGEEEELHRAIFDALSVSLGLDPASKEASRGILRSWGRELPPRGGREEPLLFYDLAPDPNAPLYTETENDPEGHGIFRFIPFSLNLVFYGFLCLTRALRVRENLFTEGEGNPRSILRKVGLYPVPTRRALSTFYDEAAGAFRKRADLVISCYLLDNSDTLEAGTLPVPDIQSEPTVIIHRKEG